MRPEQAFCHTQSLGPICRGRGRPMAIVLHEAREKPPYFSTFNCDACAPSERFVCDE